MGILAVGSVALDTVTTPAGHVEEILGGSATYFSVAASHFTDVSIVAVVGEDFPQEHVAFLQRKGIDTSGLQRQKGKTFRWRGEYAGDMNSAITLETQLNVFDEFAPIIREEDRRAEMLFLGNIDPDLQRLVLEQMERPRLVACDTMNYWIHRTPGSLRRTLALVDLVVINDSEVRDLAGERNLFKAARTVLSWGPQTLVIKRGEYGALMITPKTVFAIPAYPLTEVVDPTGAGDSFAGGLLGYLSARGTVDEATLRQSLVFGSVMASFDVTDFGLRRIGDLTFTEIENRYRELKRMTDFQGL